MMRTGRIKLRIVFGCLILTLTFNFFSVSAQHPEYIKPPTDSIDNGQDYYTDQHARYSDFIFKKNIHTILLFKEEFNLSIPLIELRSEDKLKLSFDDFEGDIKNYKYSFEHCDADWQPSDILAYQYEKGIPDDYITDYSMSINTIQKYTHYSLVFPTENLKIIESGNYIIKVFTEDHPEDIVFTKRFMVVDSRTTINGLVKRPNYVEDMDTKQQFDFTVGYNASEVAHPFTDLKVIIQQNGRWDNTLKNLKPRMVQDNLLVFDFQRENMMNGGNEFRRFDIKTLRIRTERVMKILNDNNSKFYHVYIFPDQSRSVKNYVNDMDINGKKLIKSEDNVIKSSDIEGEYVFVHFTLPYKAPRVDGSIYVLGALTNWAFKNENKMVYDFNNSAYVATLFLKQGYYNYQYVFLGNGQNTGDETLIEGNHFETENDYLIYIYHRETGTTYDKLIGVKALNSRITQK